MKRGKDYMEHTVHSAYVVSSSTGAMSLAEAFENPKRTFRAHQKPSRANLFAPPRSLFPAKFSQSTRLTYRPLAGEFALE